jgi:hypothetical protein
MSSVTRSFAQIPPTVKYFLVTNTIAGGSVPVTGGFELITGSYADIGAMISDADFAALISAGTINITAAPTDLAVGILLKDMGRQVTIYDDVAGSPHLAVYREVQIVGTTASPDWNSRFFVKVWAVDGANVDVVRTG